MSGKLKLSTPYSRVPRFLINNHAQIMFTAFSACGASVFALTFEWYAGWSKWGAFLPVGIILCSLYIAGVSMFFDVNLRRSEHRRLINYLEEFRTYTIGSIEPMKATIHALDSMILPAPPEELPQTQQERPLTTKERNTLLIIIAALCKELKIDCARHAAAAATIKNLCDLQGLRIGETTIEGYLKKLPEAVEARSK